MRSRRARARSTVPRPPQAPYPSACSFVLLHGCVATPWNIRMGSSCWGAPQHELTPRVSSEFPDLRVQYRALQRVPVALPVPRPLRAARKGQRQGQRGRAGRLFPPQLHGADPAGRNLGRVQRPSGGAVPQAPGGCPAGPGRNDRSTPRAGSGRDGRSAGRAVRRLRSDHRTGQLPSAGALQDQRLFRAGCLRPPRRLDQGLCRSGRDRLRW
ncbi:hypothetical protein JSE7799_00913 [Jannaschia seosinensis]|uniref:Uncharacterized protein n=1 Tax=Jannaschia seosinensis TaxID=313367 RepID=A0A0M7B826_9RHOB|nr:hypothetical protein JSE7799_00913 [Jannaschia seosinensis]